MRWPWLIGNHTKDNYTMTNLPSTSIYNEKSKFPAEFSKIKIWLVYFMTAAVIKHNFWAGPLQFWRRCFKDVNSLSVPTVSGFAQLFCNDFICMGVQKMIELFWIRPKLWFWGNKTNLLSWLIIYRIIFLLFSVTYCHLFDCFLIYRNNTK